jgi:3,4-dihydroxy 2-butanone 4-phosphate synthase/GTP cyclohydrolase II
MARLSDLLPFAKEHDLKIGTIADLIAWRRTNETLVQRSVETDFATRTSGSWRMIIYVNTISNVEHIALVKGDISGDDPILVRMHALDLMSDVLDESSSFRNGRELETAMHTIEKHGRGIVVVLRESSNASLSSMVSQRVMQDVQSGDNPGHDLREYGVGAQILGDLGVSKMVLISNSKPNVISIEGYDLEIVDWKPLNGEGQ